MDEIIWLMRKFNPKKVAGFFLFYHKRDVVRLRINHRNIQIDQMIIQISIAAIACPPHTGTTSVWIAPTGAK
jgi:hypothetical protein